LKYKEILIGLDVELFVRADAMIIEDASDLLSLELSMF
jgi:hypothetical protein